MRFTFEYTNTLADYMLQYGLCKPDAYHIARRLHYKMLALPAWAMALGLAAASMQRDPLLATAFLTLVGFPLCISMPFSARYRMALEQSLGSLSPVTVRLEVTDEGIEEFSEGVRMRVPWSAVRRFEVVHETLFAALAANRWMIVPRRSLSESSGSFGELVRIFQERTVGASRGEGTVPSGDG